MAGKKTVGIILRESFALLRANYKVLFCTALLVYGPFFLLDQATTWLSSSLDRKSVLKLIIQAVFLVVGSAYLVNAKAVSLVMLRGEAPSLASAGSQFKANWKRYLGITAWTFLWLYLWLMVFIVPGVVKALGYMLSSYLIIEYPSMTVRESLKKSIAISKGYKGRLFLLGLLLYIPFLPSLVFQIIMIMGHDTGYRIYVAIYGGIISLLLFEPISYVVYGIAYLDIKKAAIKKGILPY